MIKVLIVDDSALVRQFLSKGLEDFDDIEVVGMAPDPYVAREMVVEKKPDVMTLDIEMPRMDGLTFLSKLMAYFPLPVIIVSSVTTRDNQAAIKALEMGAFDVVNKPGGSISVKEVIEDIVGKIRQAYKVKATFLTRRKAISALTVTRKADPREKEYLSGVKTTGVYVAIGSSTGGTVALEYILSQLPPYLPPLLIVQHMPLNYTAPFAERLNSLSPLTVKESKEGEVLQAGHAYIARAGVHMRFARRGTSGMLVHEDSEKVSFQKPAVDVLFQSMAEGAGKNVLAIILTGMGSDGARGMLDLKKAGATTVAQDEATSVVWGMPRAAVKCGAADRVLSLDKIPREIIQFSMGHREL